MRHTALVRGRSPRSEEAARDSAQPAGDCCIGMAATGHRSKRASTATPDDHDIERRLLRGDKLYRVAPSAAWRILASCRLTQERASGRAEPECVAPFEAAPGSGPCPGDANSASGGRASRRPPWPSSAKCGKNILRGRRETVWPCPPARSAPPAFRSGRTRFLERRTVSCSLSSRPNALGEPSRPRSHPCAGCRSPHRGGESIAGPATPARVHQADLATQVAHRRVRALRSLAAAHGRSRQSAAFLRPADLASKTSSTSPIEPRSFLVGHVLVASDIASTRSTCPSFRIETASRPPRCSASRIAARSRLGSRVSGAAERLRRRSSVRAHWPSCLLTGLHCRGRLTP